MKKGSWHVSSCPLPVSSLFHSTKNKNIFIYLFIIIKEIDDFLMLLDPGPYSIYIINMQFLWCNLVGLIKLNQLQRSWVARIEEPANPTNKILHPPLDEDWEWRVSDLIDWAAHDWDCGVIATNFHRDDVEAIVRVPLSRRHIPDAIMWLPNKNGEYSVKSSFQSKEDCGLGESSGRTDEGLLWQRLWKS